LPKELQKAVNLKFVETYNNTRKISPRLWKLTQGFKKTTKTTTYVDIKFVVFCFLIQ